MDESHLLFYFESGKVKKQWRAQDFLRFNGIFLDVFGGVFGGGNGAGLMFGEGIEEGNEDAGGEPDDEVEGKSDFDEVAEFVAAYAVNERVGLVADGRGEAGGATDGHSNEKGFGIGLQRVGNLDDDGRHHHGDGVVGKEGGEQ